MRPLGHTSLLIFQGLPLVHGALASRMVDKMRFAVRQLAFTSLLLIGGLFCTGLVHAKDAPKQVQQTVPVSGLPVQARETYALIFQGGPFPYDRDGVVFGNRERLLPVRERGYYHEYTVRTPGARNRGARRIACGGPKKSPEVCFYSDDHYASFRQIVR